MLEPGALVRALAAKDAELSRLTARVAELEEMVETAHLDYAARELDLQSRGEWWAGHDNGFAGMLMRVREALDGPPSPGKMSSEEANRAIDDIHALKARVAEMEGALREVETHLQGAMKQARNIEQTWGVGSELIALLREAAAIASCAVGEDGACS